MEDAEVEAAAVIMGRTIAARRDVTADDDETEGGADGAGKDPEGADEGRIRGKEEDGAEKEEGAEGNEDDNNDEEENEAAAKTSVYKGIRGAEDAVSLASPGMKAGLTRSS